MKMLKPDRLISKNLITQLMWITEQHLQNICWRAYGLKFWLVVTWIRQRNVY